jgi:hypothetical protein
MLRRDRCPPPRSTFADLTALRCLGARASALASSR